MVTTARTANFTAWALLFVVTSASAFAGTGGGGPGPTPVAEPASLGLLAVGVAALLLGHRNRKK